MNTEKLWTDFLAFREPDGITFYDSVPNGMELVPRSGRGCAVQIESHDLEGANDALDAAYRSILHTFGHMVPVSLLYTITYDDQNHLYRVSAHQITRTLFVADP